MGSYVSVGYKQYFFSSQGHKTDGDKCSHIHLAPKSRRTNCWSNVLSNRADLHN